MLSKKSFWGVRLWGSGFGSIDCIMLCLQLDQLDRNQLASRLTLNCTDSYVEPQKLKDVYVTIMDVSAATAYWTDRDFCFLSQVFDESAISQRCKEEMYKCYPDSKRAHLKSGGNFPYLSRSSEVNLMIQVEKIIIYTMHDHLAVSCVLFQIHLMTFQGTRYCAKDPTLVNPDEIKAARGELDPPSTNKT